MEVGVSRLFLWDKVKLSKSQTKNTKSGRNTKQRKRRIMCCCRIPSGSSAGPMAMTPRRSVSTSLKSCRRSARKKSEGRVWLLILHLAREWKAHLLI